MRLVTDFRCRAAQRYARDAARPSTVRAAYSLPHGTSKARDVGRPASVSGLAFNLLFVGVMRIKSIRPVCIRPLCTSESTRLSALCRATDSIAHRHGGILLLHPRGPRSGSGYMCPDPSSLMRPHPSPSWAHRDFTARRLIRDAFAVRERLGDPLAVSGFRCPFLPDMPSSMTSGSSIVVSVQNTDVDIGLRHGPKNSALPIVPQSVSCGARFSRLHWFATATACQVAGPPVRI